MIIFVVVVVSIKSAVKIVYPPERKENWVSLLSLYANTHTCTQRLVNKHIIISELQENHHNPRKNVSRIFEYSMSLKTHNNV